MRLACSTCCFALDRLEIAIAKVAWAGYPAVELHAALTREADEAEVRYRLRANELELAALDAGPLPRVTESGDVAALAAVGRLATLARAVDCGIVVVAPEPEGDLAAFHASLCLLDRALGSVAVDLCVAHAAAGPLATPDDLHRLWAPGLPDRVGLALDPGQAYLAGWDATDLELLPVPPRHAYLSDASGERLVPPGEGRLDLPRFVAALRAGDYGGTLTALVANADPWAVEPVVRELRETAGQWLGGVD